ncbi:hypothetical protein D3C85_675770 [compost metagenome]
MSLLPKGTHISDGINKNNGDLSINITLCSFLPFLLISSAAVIPAKLPPTITVVVIIKSV